MGLNQGDKVGGADAPAPAPASAPAPPPVDENDGKVIELTNADFDKVIMGSKDLWMVFFYFSSCPHCQVALPHVEGAAARLKGKVRFAKVEGENELELKKRFGITSYPTYKIWGKSGDKKD